MVHAKKVILIAESGDVTGRDELLRELFDEKIELFCAMGKDAKSWEDVLSWIVTMASVDEGIEHDMLRSWHDEETLDDVLEFARQITVPSGETEIEIIRV